MTSRWGRRRWGADVVASRWGRRGWGAYVVACLLAVSSWFQVVPGSVAVAVFIFAADNLWHWAHEAPDRA